MTLEEAIKHAEEVAKEQDKLSKRYDDASGYSRSHNDDIRTSGAKTCERCAADHRQLAEWLRDYKRLKEQEPCEDAISRKQAIELASGACHPANVAKELTKLPSVKPAEMQEPCEDCISRKDAKKIIFDEFEGWPTDEEVAQLKRLTKQIDELPSVTPMPGWISVSERLPEEEYIGVLLTINGCKGLKVRSGMYYEGGFFHSDTGEFWKATDKEVIAWMPLPEPYEPQERGGE